MPEYVVAYVEKLLPAMESRHTWMSEQSAAQPVQGRAAPGPASAADLPQWPALLLMKAKLSPPAAAPGQHLKDVGILCGWNSGLVLQLCQVAEFSPLSTTLQYLILPTSVVQGCMMAGY